MYDIPVLEPYSGYLHLNMEQRKILEESGFIKFYESVKSPHILPISMNDVSADSVDISVCTFVKLRAGRGYVVKVTTGNPNNIPVWRGNQ